MGARNRWHPSTNPAANAWAARSGPPTTTSRTAAAFRDLPDGSQPTGCDVGKDYAASEEGRIPVPERARLRLGRHRRRRLLDDEIVELKEWDAVRVPPGTWRGYEAGPEGLEILVIGAPNLGEARREDVDGQRDWWADE
jgi:hypothetical protein